MFKLSEIKELVKLVNQTSIQELEIENEGSRLSIRKAIPQEPIAQIPVVQQSHSPVVAPPPVQQPVPQTPAAGEPAEPAQPVASQTANLHTIKSPMVGTFYAAPSPTSPPFVKVGDKVKEDTVVCIVEAMKLMNEIEAEVAGEIVEILVENGQLVEYGQPLFTVKV